MKTLPRRACRKWRHKEFGPRQREFLKLYHGSDEVETKRAADDFGGDNFLVYSTWAWLDAHVKSGGSPVYRYYFALPSPGDRYHSIAAGAFHSDEIEYVFGNLDSRQGAKMRPEDYKLSDLMQTYWTNFARTGDPNGAVAPRWPAYDAAGNWQVMRLSCGPWSCSGTRIATGTSFSSVSGVTAGDVNLVGYKQAVKLCAGRGRRGA